MESTHRKFISFIVLAIVLVRAADETAPSQIESSLGNYQTSGKLPLPAFCEEGLPTLSIKDIELDSSNYDTFKKKHEVFILGVSDSKCRSCCQSETLLKSLQDLFSQGKFNHKGKRIYVARIDISKNHLFLEKQDINFEHVPKVFIIHNQRWLGYDSTINRTDLFLHQLNRILMPLVPLITEEDVEDFFNDINDPWYQDQSTPFFKKAGVAPIPFANTYEPLRYKTRVVAFFYDKTEYKSEIKELRDDARYLANRENLRIGIVDNPKLIKKLKLKHQTKWFSAHSMSSLVLKRYDGEFKMYDFASEDHQYAHNWINKNSMKEVDELSTESYKIYELLRQPMFLLFVDFQDSRYSKASYEALEVIKQIAPKFSEVLGFMYVNNTMFYPKKRILGITWEELPAMAFNMLDQRVIPYPRGKKIEKVEVFNWFDEIMSGKVAIKTKDFAKTVNDTLISTLLNETIVATRETFKDIVLGEGYDLVLFVYSTEFTNNIQRGIALQFNIVGEAFRMFGMQKTCKAVSYDVNIYAFPEGIEFSYDLPQIYFFPAYNKRTPYIKYVGSGIAGDILKYIQKSADIKFSFPLDVSKIGTPREEESNPKLENTDKESQDDEIETVDNFEYATNEDL